MAVWDGCTAMSGRARDARAELVMLTTVEYKAVSHLLEYVVGEPVIYKSSCRSRLARWYISCRVMIRAFPNAFLHSDHCHRSFYPCLSAQSIKNFQGYHYSLLKCYSFEPTSNSHSSFPNPTQSSGQAEPTCALLFGYCRNNSVSSISLPLAKSIKKQNLFPFSYDYFSMSLEVCSLPSSAGPWNRGHNNKGSALSDETKKSLEGRNSNTGSVPSRFRDLVKVSTWETPLQGSKSGRLHKSSVWLESSGPYLAVTH